MENKPTRVYNSVYGVWVWKFNGKHHRLDGHAIESDSSKSSNEWWVNDYDITAKITQWAKENNIDLYNLTEVDKALIKLTWADYDGK